MIDRARLLAVLGSWGLPIDLPAWAALAVALYFAVAAVRRRVEPPVSRTRFLTFAGFTAAFLSLGYVAHYLRGAPRIIDATTYFLQGRALSHGHFSWPVPELSASFRGRFLLFQEPGQLAGIFPPGYPLLLAVGFLFGAPMVIGPVLAAALALATYQLARELAVDHPERERIARLAAALSIVSAALRYHTADTMSHGAAALGVTVALALSLAARRSDGRRLWVLAGLMLGWVFSTRMASALAIGAVVLLVAWGASSRRRALGWLALGTVPGMALLLAASHSATGELGRAAQSAYYAASDGPPGCFRYGFGSGVGCLFEHGDFVRSRMDGGEYGLVAALGVTLRRLREHLTDVANLEPLALLVLLAPRGGPSPRVRRRARLALALVLGHMLAYAPFYFDGNYPGGGARFYADVLPVEHAMIALATANLLPRVDLFRRAAALLSLSLVGFAVHASRAHDALARREDGRPMFEPDKLREAGVEHGLLFVETDHGFNLAHDPGVIPSHGLVAARLHGDDHDRLLHARLGHPIANSYKLTPAGPVVSRYTVASSLEDPEWRFESEADWPPLRQSGAWAEPSWPGEACASGRVLTVHLSPGEKVGSVRLELPVPRAGTWRIRPQIVRGRSGGDGSMTVWHAEDHALATWSWRDEGGGCASLPEQSAELSPPHAYVTLTTNAVISADYILLSAREAGH